MEIASDEDTRRFAGHFAGTTVPASALDQDEDDDMVNGDLEADGESDEDDGTAEMDVANTGEITSAFAQEQTSVFNSQRAATTTGTTQSAPSAMRARPRFSEVVRQQDAEDEDAMRELGMAKGGNSQEAAASSAVRPRPRFSEAARQEDAEDEELLRELGIAKGGAKPAATAPSAQSNGKGRASVMFGGVPSSDDADDAAQLDEDDDTEDHSDQTSAMDVTMDQTMALGRVLSVAGVVASHKEDQEDFVEEGEKEGGEDDEEDASMEMSIAEKTMDFDQTADMLDATTYGGIVSAPAPSTPSARLQAQLFARQLAEGILPAGTASPMRNSPRRVVFPVPAQPQQVLPTPPTVANPLKSPRVIANIPKSPSKVSSPVKARFIEPAPAASTSTPTRSTSPKVCAPLSAGRSPGGSLSLRGMLQAQLSQNAAQASPRSPYAPPSSLASSPKRAARGSWESPRAKSRVVELKGKSTEEDSTGSSFGGYLDEEVSSIDLPILAVDARR
jgi:hypothetical protein